MSSFAKSGIDDDDTKLAKAETLVKKSQSPKPSTSWLLNKSKTTTTTSTKPVSASKRKQRPVSSSEESSSSGSGSGSSNSDRSGSNSGSGSSDFSSDFTTTSSSLSSDYSSDEDDDDRKGKGNKVAVKGAKATRSTTTTKTVSKKQRTTLDNDDITNPSVDIEDFIGVDFLQRGGQDGDQSGQNGGQNGQNGLKLTPKGQDGFKLSPHQYDHYIKTVTQYLLIRDMRRDPESLCFNAPVDTMGCAVSGDREAEPKVFRFQTLVSLMLSSQTKDAITFDAVQQLRTRLNGGLTPAGVLAEQELAHECIKKTGFHNTKIVNLIKVARICQDDYQNDIPPNLKSLLALPGVGPKMANLTMQSAWGETSAGIGVDTHVHRIANMLGWVGKESTTPEKTRIGLEKVLPPQYFSEINWSLVGFGQTICPSRGPKCSECALAKNLICSSSIWSGAEIKFNEIARKHYSDHLQGIPSQFSSLIEQYFEEEEKNQGVRGKNGMGDDDNDNKPKALPKDLMFKIRKILVQKSLQNDFNITPQRIQSFMTDQPPPPLAGDALPPGL